VKRVGIQKLLRAIAEESRALVKTLIAEGERSQVGLLMVGGPVRDFLLGRPLRDVDLIVEPAPDRSAEALARAVAPEGYRVVSHDRFGTVRVEGQGAVVDLATVRAESYEQPGALPTVREGDLEDDLTRRDFTVNGLAIPLNPVARRGRPTIVDHGEGLADLESRVLRVFHRRSFHDDPTRALRAARFVPRLDFTMSRGSRSALRSALRDGAFGAVSGERFRAEIGRLFEDPVQGLDPSRALRLLADWHVLPALEPGLTLPAESVAPLRRLGRAIAEPPWHAERRRPWVVGLMVWMAPLDASLRRRALQRLAVTGETAGKIVAFPKARDLWLRKLGRARGRGSTDAALSDADEEQLLALMAWAPPNLRRRIQRYAFQDRGAALPISGDDLLAIGMRGPAVGRALARIRVAYLDRAVRDREEALALAREIARRGGRRKAGGTQSSSQRPGPSRR
jgi:tRNA nucleotidyltransferase (CCA-adding enzyme)